MICDRSASCKLSVIVDKDEGITHGFTRNTLLLLQRFKRINEAKLHPITINYCPSVRNQYANVRIERGHFALKGLKDTINEAQMCEWVPLLAPYLLSCQQFLVSFFEVHGRP